MSTQDLIDTVEINLAAAGRDLATYREVFYGDRDAATEYRRATLPGQTALPEPPPPGQRAVRVVNMNHIAARVGIWTLCGLRYSERVNEELHLTIVDCLACLDTFTRMIRR